MEALRERGTRFFDEKPVITNQTIGVVENVLQLFIDLTREQGRYRGDFSIAMSKETVRVRKHGNAGPFQYGKVLSLHFWCMNPAVAFEVGKENS